MSAAENNHLARDSLSAMDALWPEVIEELGLQSAQLISSNYYDYARRVYARGDRIYKITLPEYEATSRLRNQSLKGEYEILKKLSGLAGVPVVFDWKCSGKYESLVMEKIEGERIDCLGFLGFLNIISRLCMVLVRLGLRGVSHNDLRLDNILATNNAGVSLIDYDQATHVSFLLSVSRSFLGINIGADIVHGNLMTIVKEYFKAKLPRNLVALLKKLPLARANNKLPSLLEDASSNAHLLLEAWRIAQLSDASAPTITLAYYSFNFDGYQFPGERPWEKRWEVLRSITNFNHRRILELGCNMSLLSCFLIREEKSAATMAVDIDANILESAKLVSAALSVAPEYRQIDFDSPANWEDELSGFNPDVVFALNVLNWVQDKKRFLKFLGRFDEVIFEGHDSFEIEKQRFTECGFSKILLVCMTERNRPVLHCRK